VPYTLHKKHSVEAESQQLVNLMLHLQPGTNLVTRTVWEPPHA